MSLGNSENFLFLELFFLFFLTLSHHGGIGMDVWGIVLWQMCRHSDNIKLTNHHIYCMEIIESMNNN